MYFFVGLLGNTRIMEDITKSWDNLSLNEREGSDFTLKDNLRSSEFITAAKFLTRRALNLEVVARTFRQLWKSVSGFKIRSIEDHIVLFVFSSQLDVTRIFQSEPWSFDKHLVVLESFEGDIPTKELQFRKATFWIQVHDIPIRFMTRSIAESICDIIGEVSKSIGEGEEDRGSFICVKVTLDISLPLCRG